jgi:DNA-binding XRE family transcriptional regulator
MKNSVEITPQFVRDVRHQLEMTQQQFADHIGVGKVTVTRWEAGARKCQGEYAKKVSGLAAKSMRTKTIFDLLTTDLSTLDSKKAVEAFRDLLWSECRRNQVPTSELRISSREVRDGGIDAELPASTKFIANDSFLEGGAYFFQIKAGQSWKPWLKGFAKKELLNKQGKLGSEVHRCLTEEGWYVLVCFGNDLTSDQIKKTHDNIKQIFSSKGFPDARIKIWGQNQLLGHFNRFPFLSLQIMGRNKHRCDSWLSWNTSSEMSGELELGEAQVNLLKEIRRLVRDKDVSHIRLIGEPGLGKTRLVHEALGEPDLRPQVIYFSNAELFQESQLFHDLLNTEADYYLILVLDECRPRDCEEIWHRLSNHSDRCTVITLDHDSYYPASRRFSELECPRLDDGHVEKIINSYIGDVGNSRRWAELCSGVPRVAHAVGRTLLTNPGQILQTPTLKLVWDRFISGNYDIDSAEAKQKRIVLRYISLFHRFGFDSPVESEGEFIAELIHEDNSEVTYSRFQDIVGELIEQRILQGKSTLFIAPKLLHVHLWAEFWEKHGRAQPISGLIKRIQEIERNQDSEALLSWFIQMFSYAGESRVAIKQVKILLGPDGPFCDAAFALSKVGCRLLHELSNASPEYTVDCLERVFELTTSEDLFRFHEGRQDIVWALERIAVWPQFFQRAAKLLRRLAESENSSYANNSTGAFVDLFSFAPGQAAPTGAPPEIRIPVLNETLDSSSPVMRRLGIKACKSAMSTLYGGRVVGREHQGLKTAQLWTPQKWGEVYQAMGLVWSKLYTTSRSWESSLRSEANYTLIDSIVGLLQITCLSDEILDTIEILVDDDATDLQQLVQDLSRIRRYWKDSYDSSVIDRLEEIDLKITGASFSSRVRRIVHLSGLDDYGDEDGLDLNTYTQLVDELALEASQSDDKFQEILSDLVRGTNSMVYQFGCEYAKYDRVKNLEKIIEAHRAIGNESTTLLFSGYLKWIFNVDSQKWEDIIEELLSDDTFANLIGPIIRSSGYSDRIILSMLSRFDTGVLDNSCLRSFGYADCFKQIQETTFLEFVRRLTTGGLTSYAIELFDFRYCDMQKPRQLPEVETVQLLQYFNNDGTRSNTEDYHWSEVARLLIDQYPMRSTDVFNIALLRVANEHWYLDDYNSAYKLIKTIIKGNPEKYWQVLRNHLDNADRSQRSRLIHWLGPKNEFGSEGSLGPLPLFPVDSVFEWVAEDPEARAYELTKAVPKSLGRDKAGVWARELLSRYGDLENVRSGLLAHFWSGGWQGNLSDRYRKLRDDARGWLESESSLRVRQWLEGFIDGLSSDIERSEIEEEREF